MNITILLAEILKLWTKIENCWGMGGTEEEIAAKVLYRAVLATQKRLIVKLPNVMLPPNIKPSLRVLKSPKHKVGGLYT